MVGLSDTALICSMVSNFVTVNEGKIATKNFLLMILQLIEQTAKYNMWQGCRTPGSEAARTTKFCTEALNIYESSVRKVFLVALIAPRILRWLPERFEKMCIPDI
jgi:hypothetical protein